MTSAPQFVGALPRERLLEFIAVYSRNGSSCALPTDTAERHRELMRRAARIDSLLTRPFGLANTADVVNHLELIERFYGGELPSAPLGDQTLCAVLEPPEFVCSFCAEEPCLRTESDDRRAQGKLLVLTENGVLPGEAYVRTCPRCDAKYYYDRIARSPALEECAAGIERRMESRFRDAVHLLPYIRCDSIGKYVVASSTLLRHHAANERIQESALGVVQTLSVAHSVLLGSVSLWAPSNHASTYLDAAYMKWLLLRRDWLMAKQRASSQTAKTWNRITPDELASVEGTRAVYLRFSAAMQEDGIVRWAEGHDMTCLLLDDCNIVVADGNHKVKWPCCKYDDVRYVEIPDVAQIPFGCEIDRLATSDVCPVHLRFVGRRTPVIDDGVEKLDSKEVKDFCRADGLVYALERRAIRRTERKDAATKAADVEAARMTACAYVHSGELPSGSVGASSSSVPPSSVLIPATISLHAAPAPVLSSAEAKRDVLSKRKRGVAHTLATNDTDDEEVQPAMSKQRGKVDKAIDKILNQRLKRSTALEKLERTRTLAEQVLQARHGQHAAEQSKLGMSDVTRFNLEFPLLHDAEYLEGGRTRAWHGLGDNAYLVEKIVGRKTIGLVEYHAVKFVGWKKATWEPSNSNLQKEHVEAYKAAVEAGQSEVCILPMDEAMQPNPNLPLDVVTMSMTQFASSLAQSDCGVLKIEQVGEPAAGYLNTTAGVILVGAACRRILLMMPMRNSETTTQTLWMLFLLKSRAPRWAERLKGFCSDMACKVLLHVRAKLRDLPADSPAMPHYEWLNQLAIFVDNFHIDNHSEGDAFCVQNTHPDLFPDLSTLTNTEVCEELFRWWSRFKLMINHMGNAKANYFMQEMRELHNERSLRWDTMSVKFMPGARLAELRAAYGLESVVDSTSARAELADFLLSQHGRPLSDRRTWSPELLSAHRTRVGGRWRDVFAREKGLGRKRKAAAP